MCVVFYFYPAACGPKGMAAAVLLLQTTCILSQPDITGHSTHTAPPHYERLPTPDKQPLAIPAPEISRQAADVGELTSAHILLDCPSFCDARNDLFPTTNQNLCFDATQLPQLVAFLRRTGLGFS